MVTPTMRRLMTLVFLICTSGAPVAKAAEAPRAQSTPADQESISLTIYNDNLGLVKEIRSVRLPQGVIDLWFLGVAAQIDPTSVAIRSLDAPRQLTVLEQNFEYDLIEPARLMEKYLGRTVQLVQWRDDKEIVVDAKLIGNSGGYVYEIGDKIAINPGGRVLLPELPEGLISQPSLVWMLENRKEKHRLQASYLTGGIGWKANYVAVLDKNDRKLGLSGWVTINNQSGATYENARLKLVAGDVNRVEPMRRPIPPMESSMDAFGGRAQFAEESFFEYHLYSLERPATVKNNQTKQISLLDASDIGAKKTFVYSPAGNMWFRRFDGVDRSTKVGVFLSVENAKANGLGMPLPKGVVRVYKEDNSGSLQFVGEDAIDHTPEDETVRIKMGNAFDVVAERVQTDFSVLASGHLYRSSYKISIRNHKEEAITVSAVELLSGDWEIEKSSHEFVKESSHRVRFDVPVPAKGSAELTYTVRIQY